MALLPADGGRGFELSARRPCGAEFAEELPEESAGASYWLDCTTSFSLGVKQRRSAPFLPAGGSRGCGPATGNSTAGDR